MKNRQIRFTSIVFALVVFALSPIAQAVTPAPDGGCPGFNTAEGQNALFSRTTGMWNTALGAFTLYGDTTGTGNTAVGINVLRNNVMSVQLREQAAQIQKVSARIDTNQPMRKVALNTP
jgi:hypothetical protein